MNIGAAVANVYNAIMTDQELGSQFFENRHLSVAGGNTHDGLNFASLGMIAKPGPENTVFRNDTFERGLNDLFRSCGNHIKGKPVASEIVQHPRQQAYILVHPNSLAHLYQ